MRAIARAAGEADPAAFLPVAYRDLDELDGFLEHLAREVHDPAYRALLDALLSATTRCAAGWRRAPCTRAGHHAYLGGLLEHTVAVAHARRSRRARCTRGWTPTCCSPRRSSTTSARRASSRYGAEIGLTDEGRLLGHVVLGLRMLDERSRRPDWARRAGSRWRTAC